MAGETGRAGGPGDLSYAMRRATARDAAALNGLIRESVLGLGGERYSPAQLASALEHLFGVDTRLIDDGTYFVVEEGPALVACGGWSRRRTLFGGDRYADRVDDLLDRETEPARIRAFFVHPEHARRGLGRLLLAACEREARDSGYRRLELMATLTGVPLYQRAGFRIVSRLDLELPDGIRFPLAKMQKDLGAG